MRILIAAVGRLKAGPERALFEHYAGRVTFPFCLKEVEEKRRLAAGKLTKREAELLLGAAPQGAVIIAMDERGQALSSAALANRIGAWRDEGWRDLAFLIGGPQGLDESLKGRADLVLSLGPMTWPHMLARGLLAEQIYRAQCILSGHPYHKQ